MLTSADVDWIAANAKSAGVEDINDLRRYVIDLAMDHQWLKERLWCLLQMLKREPTWPEERDPNFPEEGELMGPLWYKVSQMTGLGKTSAAQLCIDMGEDPDHVKPRPEPEEDDDESDSDG